MLDASKQALSQSQTPSRDGDRGETQRVLNHTANDYVSSATPLIEAETASVIMTVHEDLSLNFDRPSQKKS